jgi:tRNA (guanine37-N1)-methyltransferase
LNKTSIVCDVFAGVGPFSIRAAKIGCKVLANDLNPASYEYLCVNISKNKVFDKVKAFNQDARMFLTTLLSNSMPELGEFVPFTDIYMNLPMDAIEFLDVLQGNFDRDLWKTLPTVHVYGFANDESELIARMQSVWGEFDTSCLKFHQFRDISPKKYMFCIEFVLPESIAYKTDEEVLRKVRKIDE